MPKFLNAHPSRFLSHHVGRDAPLRVLERALGHLIALFSFALRAQSLRGHNGEVVLIAKKCGDACAPCHFVHLLTSSRETATSVSDAPYCPIETEYRIAAFSS